MQRLIRVVWVLAVLLVPAMAHAQASITGVVRDASGGVLPGVSVEASSPALIEKVRVVVTDGNGQYRFVDLRPGTYSVTFKLGGFSTVKRDNIELTGSFVASVDGELKVGAVEEVVSVTAESPIVDIQRTTGQRVFDQEIIEAIPAGRSHIDLAVLVPGLSASQPGRGALADVGGTNNLQNTQFSIHGGRTADTRLQLDGVRLGNVLSQGEFSNFVPDTGSTEEIAIDYAAISAEQPYGGLRIDIIPRQGGNTVQGSIFGTGVNSSWQGSNLTDKLRTAGLPDPNEMKRAYDINTSVGGPIVRDKLWFFASARWQQNQNYIAGSYVNANAGNPNEWLRVEDRSRRGFFSLEQNGVNARLTYQAARKHKVAIYYDNQSRIWDDGRTGVSPESFVAFRYPRLNLAQASWTSPMTNKLLFEGRLAVRGEAFGNQLPEEGSIYRSLIPVFDNTNQIHYRGKGGDGGASGTLGYSSQKINTAVASMSYVTGGHAFKVGVSDTWARTDSSTESNLSNLYYRFTNNIPDQFTMYGTPIRTATLVKAELGVYAQDRWTLGRYTLNYGLRYDYYAGGYPDQFRGPTPFLPNQNYSAEGVTAISMHDITPRLGVAYDLFGNGKTAVKATLGKYALALSIVGVGNPLGVTSTAVRAWTDADRDYVVDCDLLNMAAQNPIPTAAAPNPSYNPALDTCGAGPSNYGQLTSVAQFDEDTRFGWGNRLYNWEFSTSVQHQVIPRVAVDVGYFRRWFGNFTAVQTRGLTSADYDRYSVVAPVDSRLPDGGGYTIDGLYNLKPEKVGAATTLYTAQASDFGKQIEHWNGMDFSVNARVRNGVMLQGGISTGRTTTDNCDIIAHIDGNPGQRNCHVQAAFLTQAKLLGTYLVPKVDVNLAATFQSTPGVLVAANRNYNSSEVVGLGRPLSGAGTVSVNLLNPGDMYGDRINQFDLRFGRAFRFGTRRVTTNLDIYNVFNASPVMQLNSAYAVWLTPQRIMDARLFKISAQLNF